MVRRALGRGLGALIEDSENASSGQPADGFITLGVEQIAPSPFQPRKHFDADKLQELARAIERQGIIEPLVVRHRILAGAGDPAYELIAGESRLRAAKSAGLVEVPAILRDLD